MSTWESGAVPGVGIGTASRPRRVSSALALMPRPMRALREPPDVGRRGLELGGASLVGRGVLREAMSEQHQRNADQQRRDHRSHYRAPEVGPSFTEDLLPRDLRRGFGRLRDRIPQFLKAVTEAVDGPINELANGLINAGHVHQPSEAPQAARLDAAGR